MSPLQWLLAARVRRPQEFLQTTAWSIEKVAYETGFGSATALRENFRRVAGTSPQNFLNAAFLAVSGGLTTRYPLAVDWLTTRIISTVSAHRLDATCYRS